MRQQRFRQEHEKCILCGRCVRMCEEQMMAKAIGFRGRGERRSLGTPFDEKSPQCRTCGGCIYVCPACELRCTYTDQSRAVCGGCANLSRTPLHTVTRPPYFLSPKKIFFQKFFCPVRAPDLGKFWA